MKVNLCLPLRAASLRPTRPWLTRTTPLIVAFACALGLFTTALLAATPEAVDSAADSLRRCEPEPEVAAVLQEAAASLENCQSVEKTDECWETAERLLADALRRWPRDHFLHQDYQLLFRILYFLPSAYIPRYVEVEKHYAELANAHPDDALYLYLHAQLKDSEEHAALLQRVAELKPESPWPQLVLAKRAASDQPELLRQHLEGFLHQCPTRLDLVVPLHRRFTAPEFWWPAVRAAGERYAADPVRYLEQLPTLWDFQFKLTPLDEHETLRRQVAEQVETIAALELRTDERWWRTLEHGYELVGAVNDATSQAADEFQQAMDVFLLCRDTAQQAIFDSYRVRAGTQEGRQLDRQAELRAQRDFTAEWLQKCPKSSSLLKQHLTAVASLPDPDPAQLVALGDRLLRLHADGLLDAPAELLVARHWQDHGLEADRIPGLLHTAEERLQRIEELQAATDLEALPEQHRRQFQEASKRTTWTLRLNLARLWFDLGNTERSAQLVRQLQQRLQVAETAAAVLEAEGEEPPRGTFPVTYYRHSLWRLQADLAERQERFADAALHLRRLALAGARGGRLEASPLETNQLEQARDLWQRAGGSDEGWALLDELEASAVAAAAEAPEPDVLVEWVPLHKPLPAFELTDIDGQRWTLEDLRGKTVFVNFWATWCPPCIEELPLVQTLHEQVAEQDDIVLVTFNVDESVGLVGPFLDKHGYGFPALLAAQYFNSEAVGGGGIPRNWVVDAEGVLRAESTGFSPRTTEEEWLTDIRAQLQAAQAVAEPTLDPEASGVSASSDQEGK